MSTNSEVVMVEILRVQHPQGHDFWGCWQPSSTLKIAIIGGAAAPPAPPHNYLTALEDWKLKNWKQYLLLGQSKVFHPKLNLEATIFLQWPLQPLARSTYRLPLPICFVPERVVSHWKHGIIAWGYYHTPSANLQHIRAIKNARCFTRPSRERGRLLAPPPWC